MHCQVSENYRLSKLVFDFKDNSIIKLTKRLLLGPDNNEMPSMLLVNGQTLPIKIFTFLSSLAESGLTELQHYVGVLDIQRYHQINLSEIKEDLSKVIIKT